MRKASLYRYSVPMEAGIILRYQRLKTRDGFIVHLSDGENEGWGEVAPLPEFSAETLEQAQQQAQDCLQVWAQGKITDLSGCVPSVAFGLSCALAELSGQLPTNANYNKAPLCTGDPDDLLDVLNDMTGKKVAKVKVGLYEAVRDGIVVNTLLEAIPDLYLRLDANRSWTLEKAYGFAKYVNPDFRARIAFLEEPCKSRDDSRQFAQETGIAIAWDESTREADFVLQAEAGVSAIVLKPTLLGDINYCQQLAQQAQQAGLEVVISSSIESSFALTQLARIAAWLTPESVPGLDTLSLMQAQVLRSWPDSDLPVMNLEDLSSVWQS